MTISATLPYTLDGCCEKVKVTSDHATAPKFTGTYTKDATNAYYSMGVPGVNGNFLYVNEAIGYWTVSKNMIRMLLIILIVQ